MTALACTARMAMPTSLPRPAGAFLPRRPVGRARPPMRLMKERSCSVFFPSGQDLFLSIARGDANSFRSPKGVQMTNIRRLLRRDPAGRYIVEKWGIPCSTKWLAKLAVVGGGPVFRKAGRFPLYDPEDLDRWAASRIGPKQKSTSELV
jgi:hypothetical protein